MALIQCLECGREISDKAPACPGCGAPAIRAATVIEQTSKWYKGWKIIGALLFIAGGLTMMASTNMTAGMVLLVGGVGMYLGAAVGAWWDHG